MTGKITLLMLLITLSVPSAAKPVSAVVAKFGGECEGAAFQPSPLLVSLIRNVKSHENYPCDSAFCGGSFAYDLNGDGRNEHFVRLSCGATGNCNWGIFSDRPAQLRGTFTAWFFYIHQRNTSWNTLTTYTREGGDRGIIATLRSRRGKYVQASERTERGDYRDPQPFLTRMGVPKCS
jgi:hypothetical protein